MAPAVFRRVFRHNRYVALAVGVAFLVLSATLLLPYTTLLMQVFDSNALPFGEKVAFLIGLYGSLVTKFTLLSATYVLLVAVLFGLNLALLVFYIQKRRVVAGIKNVQLTSLGGIVSSVLGIGCVACGSVVLTAVLGTAGAGGLLAALPLHGIEFGIVGTILLATSTVYLIRKIHDPLVCPLA